MSISLHRRLRKLHHQIGPNEAWKAIYKRVHGKSKKKTITSCWPWEKACMYETENTAVQKDGNSEHSKLPPLQRRIVRLKWCARKGQYAPMHRRAKARPLLSLGARLQQTHFVPGLQIWRVQPIGRNMKPAQNASEPQRKPQNLKHKNVQKREHWEEIASHMVCRKYSQKNSLVQNQICRNKIKIC